MSVNVLDSARAFARAGFPVFPCSHDKRPLVKWKEAATTDDAAICQWWRDWPGAMIGLPTGSTSGRRPQECRAMTSTENARRERAGAVSAKFSGFRSQHNRTTDKTQFQPGSDECAFRLVGPRFERQIERLHRLGPRPIVELLAEIVHRTGQSRFIADRLQAYAELDPAVLCALGADSFPPMPLELVK